MSRNESCTSSSYEVVGIIYVSTMRRDISKSIMRIVGLQLAWEWRRGCRSFYPSCQSKASPHNPRPCMHAWNSLEAIIR